MKRSFENQQPRIVKSRGITLRGKTLEAHLGKIEKRIEVLECMRGQAEAGNTGDASIEADLETASGAPARAVIRGEQMQLIIETECSGGQTSFKLTNEGGRWPRLAEINIHRMDTKGGAAGQAAPAHARLAADDLPDFAQQATGHRRRRHLREPKLVPAQISI
jgi:hypothetical protein